MKHFTTLIFLVLLSGTTLQAQIKFEATGDYGKLTSFVYDPVTPNKLYALTYKNHIMVSTDNGTHWSPFFSFSDTWGSLSQLKLTPAGSALSFVCEFSKSELTDGVYVIDRNTAEILQHFPTPNPDVYPSILSYSFFDDTYQDVIIHDSYAIGLSPFSSVFHSSDKGSNWNEIYFSGDYVNVHVSKAAFSPADKKTIYMTRNHGDTDVDGGLFKSTDAGINWTEYLKGVILEPIAFNPEDPNEILLGTGIAFGQTPEALYKSNDGGEHWDEMKIEWSEGILDCIVDIRYNPANPEHIWLLEENEIVISKDGGETWTNKVYPVGETAYYYGTGMDFDPADGNHVVIATDFFPIHSSDYGITYDQITGPFHNVVSVAAANYGTTQRIYYGAQGGYFEKNLVTGTTQSYDLSSVAEFNPPTVDIIADETINGRVFFFSSNGGFMPGILSYSDDFGETKKEILSDFAVQLLKVVKDPNQTNIYWIALRTDPYNGKLFKVKLTGAEPEVTEIPVTEDEGVVVGISIGDDGDIIVAKGIKIYTSTNGGDSWTDEFAGLESLDLATDLIWSMCTNPSDANELIVATTQGLFASSDRGKHWENIFHDFNTFHVTYSTRHAGVILTTKWQGSEIAYSLNNGSTWHHVAQEDLGHLGVQNVDFLFKANEITAFFATFDLGIVSYTIPNIILGMPEDLSGGFELTLYPSPATDVLYVSSPQNDVGAITVYDVKGTKIMESRAHQEPLKVSALQSGMYLVKVTNSHGRSTTQKFFKK